MDPQLSFTIPSIHENVILDCRLFYSPSTPAEAHGDKLRGIIIAHPYAPLGGCYDDPVVSLIVDEALKASHGFICTFNFRGAPGSAGRTSWTGKAERADFISVAAFMLWFLQFYARNVVTSSENAGLGEPEIQLLLGGYSYGSWICCHLLDVEELWQQNFGAHKGTAWAEINSRAHHLAAQTSISLSKTPSSKSREVSSMFNGSEAENFEKINRKMAHRPSLEVAYLLISLLLPPVSAFVTLPVGIGALRQLGNEELEILSSHRTLVLFGNDDAFTSGDKLQEWARCIASRPASKSTYVAVADAGHFWRTQSAQNSLRDAVSEWLRDWH